MSGSHDKDEQLLLEEIDRVRAVIDTLTRAAAGDNMSSIRSRADLRRGWAISDAEQRAHPALAALALERVLWLAQQQSKLE